METVTIVNWFKKKKFRIQQPVKNLSEKWTSSTQCKVGYIYNQAY